MPDITARWEIVPLSTPMYIHACSKCGKKTAFRCDEKIRVNAQQKTVDVWNIFKCENCDKTWNVAVMSRVLVRDVDPALLEAFHANDRAAAWRYAFDRGVMRRNAVQPDYSRIGYEIRGDSLSLDGLLNGDCSSARLVIHTDFFFNLKLESVVRRLGLSASQLAALTETGAFSFGLEYKKHRLQPETDAVLDIDCAALRVFFGVRGSSPA